MEDGRQYLAGLKGLFGLRPADPNAPPKEPVSADPLAVKKADSPLGVPEAAPAALAKESGPEPIVESPESKALVTKLQLGNLVQEASASFLTCA